MQKRILAFLLCLCLAASALPVSAAPQTEEGRICQAIIDDYCEILRDTKMESLQGYCGLMASWQLYLLGVNDWVMSHHGKDQFDAYCDMAVTSGGHQVKTYSYRDYTLEEALNAITKNGTWDAYNILVGFEKTSTALGSVYGHSLVIYAILDGIVYFTEGFSTSMGSAGSPFQVTIEEFVDYYDDWTVFEGIAVFGKKGYVANCSAYATNVFLEVTQQTTLYSQPCAPGQAESEALRTVMAGERLWANALYENPQGQIFYQIDDSGTAGYIPAEAVTPFYFNYEDVGISNLQIPEELAEGEKGKITGRIASEYGAMGAVEMTLTDENGSLIFSHALAKRSGVYDLESDTFSKLMDLSGLEAGTYTFTIQAEGIDHYVHDGKILSDSQTIELVNSRICVGGATPSDVQQTQTPTVKDGWVWENKTWYYYEDGVPRTGWYCYHGGDYYLKADGSVTTGWAKINGKYRYFSDTGSMRTGWMETQAGTLYLMSNGAPATGRRTIDGKDYFFDENGILQ